MKRIWLKTIDLTEVIIVSGIMAALLLPGCTHKAKALKTMEPAAAERARELVQGAGLANQATEFQVSSLMAQVPSNAVPSVEKAQKATAVTGDQLRRAGAILGAPAQDQSQRIASLLSENAALAAAAHTAETARMKQEADWITEKRQLEAKLIEYGARYEEERNKSIVRRFWLWATGTFGLLGGIAFVIFCPAIALPLLGRLLGWLVEKIPAMASFLGVVGHKVLSNVVAGVQKAKESLDEKAKATLSASLYSEIDSGADRVVQATKQDLAVKAVKGQ